MWFKKKNKIAEAINCYNRNELVIGETGNLLMLRKDSEIYALEDELSRLKNSYKQLELNIYFKIDKILKLLGESSDKIEEDRKFNEKYKSYVK